MTDEAIAHARARFQREADRLRSQVREGEAEAERVREEAETEPAEGTSDAVRQLGEIRGRLDRDLASLEARLAPRNVLLTEARTVGGAALAGISGLAVIAALLRRRGEKRKHEQDLRTQAAEIARFLPTTVVAAPARTSAAAAEAVIEVTDAATEVSDAAAEVVDAVAASGEGADGGRGRGLLLLLASVAAAVAGYVAVTRRGL